MKGFKKDVLTKIHVGGARYWKRKQLNKQFGKVEIPQEAFISILKISKE